MIYFYHESNSHILGKIKISIQLYKYEIFILVDRVY